MISDENHGKGPVYDAWQKAGGKQSGSWPEVFGWPAGEFMTALGIANYIDGVAEAGKNRLWMFRCISTSG